MGGITLIENQVGHYFQSWEETSYKLEMLQTEKNCATSEFNSLLSRKGPKYQLILNEAKRLPKRVPHRRKLWFTFTTILPLSTKSDLKVDY